MLPRISPKEALNQAYRKQKPSQSDLEHFLTQLRQLLEKAQHSEKAGESEENFKNLLIDFLKNTYYQDRYQINTYERTDLVIHNDKSAKSSVGILLEVKKPSNKAEMVTADNLNAKAFQELLLYYFRQKDQGNNDLKHCIITNLYEWYIFDASEFYREFEQDKALKKEYLAWRDKQKEDTITKYFYQRIAAPAIAQKQASLRYTYFNLRDYEALLPPKADKVSRKLIWLYKLLSPEHLLKQSFANDSNSLDRRFYNELLHIIGLTEVKQGGKKLIERPPAGERHPGSILENTLSVLQRERYHDRLPHPEQYGETADEQLFAVALELCITWLNRILFLKLLEAQLITYRQSKAPAFLHPQKIPDFDRLNSLFFEVLAYPWAERDEGVKQYYGDIPYLNSSLFESTELEYATIRISNLKDHYTLPAHRQTVLKDAAGKPLRGEEISTLPYLLRFLDAYDFSAEGSEEVQRDNKTLINASVLGLIFEKINGYKDGSFFTPGFITMYMSRETIRRAVVRKGNAAFGLECNSFDELKNYASGQYYKTDFVEKANELINSLTICDPTVGSGHFLVSALNELLAIKSELGVLADRAHKALPVRVAVVNDELIVTDQHGDFFAYRPGVADSQRVQESLFPEKERLIEGCLFGVDINPNSVKICRLRLWIELLKNAYYTADSKYQALETLPNIDINIKTGNALLYRFDLQQDLSEVFQKKQFKLPMYKDTVAAYKRTRSPAEKKTFLNFIQQLKEEIKTEVNKYDPLRKDIRKYRGQLLGYDSNVDIFGNHTKDPEFVAAERKRLTALIKQKEQEIEAVENNALYRDAFEWRFEFPEVLDKKGNFVGFDVVIGNPPYIRQEEIKDQKPYLRQRYDTYAGTADLLVYFVELSMQVLKDEGHFTYIIANKFMRANFGSALRKWLQQYQFEQVIDFGDLPVFEEATTYPCIISLRKAPPATSFLGATVATLDFESLPTYLDSIRFSSQQSKLSNQGWTLTDEKVQVLLDKIKSKGKPLEQYVNGKIYRGVLTGLNEAFVIDAATRESLIAEDARSAEVIKPFLAGRDVKRYQPLEASRYILFIPWHFPLHKNTSITGVSAKAEEAFRKTYPAIYDHLLKFKDKLSKRNEAETGIRYEWYALQRCAATYFEEFDRPKIVVPAIVNGAAYSYDRSGAYSNDKTSIIAVDDFYLLGLLNAKAVDLIIKYTSSTKRGGYFEYKPMYVSQLPIPNAPEDKREEIRKCVSDIMKRKEKNPAADTLAIEAQIDQLVYELYDLTEEEIALIEGSGQ